ncbi:MAG TPA: hypothetical protein VEG39_08480 [Clostridia bacterium]|nr:hypothetical protein [Clostridia bacterium]
MKLFEAAKLHIRPGSTAYDDMLMLDLIDRLTQTDDKQQQKRNRREKKQKARDARFKRCRSEHIIG